MSQVDIQPETIGVQPHEPAVFEFESAPDVAAAFERFARQPRCLLLESSNNVKTSCGDSLGRYSFLMAHPASWLEVPPDTANPFSDIRKWLTRIRSSPIAGLPPFQGGLAGLLSYDLNRSFEKIAPTLCEFPLPAIALGVYDTIVAWDHEQGRAWIISHGITNDKFEPCTLTASQRIHQFRQILELPPGPPATSKPDALDLSSTPARYVVPGPPGIVSNFSRDHYIGAVERAIEYIYAGDVYQINFAQSLLYRANCHASELYSRLRRCNPAPFSGYFDLGNSQIVSASPERLIGVRDRDRRNPADQRDPQTHPFPGSRLALADGIESV